MFGHRFFGARYFGQRYFGGIGAEAVVTEPPYRAEMSMTSRAPTIGVSSRTPTLTLQDA